MVLGGNCGPSLTEIAGNLIGTKRISLLVDIAGFDALRMVSNRNIKISASINNAPWYESQSGLVDSRRDWFPLRPAI
jgi:hypothetical protein